MGNLRAPSIPLLGQQFCFFHYGQPQSSQYPVVGATILLLPLWATSELPVSRCWGNNFASSTMGSLRAPSIPLLGQQFCFFHYGQPQSPQYPVVGATILLLPHLATSELPVSRCWGNT